ncbi:MAG: hypothetical protein NC338_08705 [Firmicutes bacterium]|nr:hypothetical protein [Bacillota bacterium]MCM1402065.1 hypothetical protein [Bacteroides sp.]
MKSKFGNNFDVTAVTEKLKGIDLGNFSMTEIIEKVKGDGLVGDLDGDGVKESVFEEIKGKIGSIFS